MMVRNLTAKSIGEIGVRALSSGVIFALAHLLGASTFGEYSTAYAFASLFVIGVDLGTNAILTREIARRPEERRLIIGNANLLKGGASLLVIGLIHIAGIWSAFAREHRLLVDTVGVMTVAYTLVDYMAALLAGKEEFGWEAFLKVVCRLIIAGAGVAVLWRTRELIPTTVTMAVASVAALAVGAIILYARFGAFPVLWDNPTMSRLLKSSLPLLGFVIFWIFYDNQDILILNYFKMPEHEIGYFWSATKVIDVLKVVPVLLSGVFFPSLARFAQTRESFMETVRQMLGWSIVVSAVIVAIAFVGAPMIERMLYGKQFEAAAPLLRLLLPAYALVFFNHMALQILIARDREKDIVPGAVIACLGNLAASFYWIPKYGTYGACFALVASEILFFFFLVRLVFRSVPDLMNPFRRTYG